MSARSVHYPALDGWRGVAIAAVVCFHVGYGRGGWLGVDLFLVLSGFLITRLLVTEWRRDGSISLGAFWGRRARRLLPALVPLLAAIAIYAVLHDDPLLLRPNLANEMLATIFYVANWHALHSGSGYWDAFVAPTPLEHMWSLAIEEQFYVLYPFVMVAILAVTRARRVPLAAVLGGAAILSWARGVTLLAGGAPFERVYLGTDTRIGAVLLGAAAGALSTDRRLIRRRIARTTRVLVVPAVIVIVVGFVALDGAQGWSPARWLLLPVFELAVVVVLLAAVQDDRQTDWFRSASSFPVLTWLGKVSYGLYLWHVPVLLVADERFTDVSHGLRSAGAVAVSLAIAQVSSSALELPIRRASWPRPRWWAAGVTGLVVAILATVVVWDATEPARAQRVARTTDGEPSEEIVAAPEEPEPTVPPSTPPSTTTPPDPNVDLPVLPMARPVDRPPRLLVLGDSLTVDISAGMRATAAEEDVTVSVAGMVGCTGGGQVDGLPADASKCDAWLESWIDLAETAQPDLVLVLRGTSRHPEHVVGDPAPCSAEFRTWFRATTLAEVDRIRQAVDTVVLASFAYTRFFGERSDEVDRLTDCRNDVLRAIAEDRDDVAYLPVGEWVCPDADSCVSEIDGVTLRVDGMHFREDGALLASRWILARIFEPA